MNRPHLPEKPTLDGLEKKWSAHWRTTGTYRFDRTRAREEVYSIDTPPPTVSGALHVGHVFSYTQTDVIARYQRMSGKAVFYPIGWDDNGLPTERRVQEYFGVRCDPRQAYQNDFAPPQEKPASPVSVSRPNFVELCFRLTTEDEQAFEDLYMRLGLSFDWEHQYTTIGERARRTSQALFLRNLARGEAYRQEAPTLWDVDFQTAVAQAELEERERAGAYHKIRFSRAQDRSGFVEIETTRPELLPSCVALVAHPSDERYRPLFGSEVTTPLFAAPVPVVAHHLAEPDKGTGIAMVCTFGDLTDVTWWRDLSLPTRTVIERDGRFGEAAFGEDGWASEEPVGAARNYAELKGLTVPKARERIVEMLRASGDLIGEPRPVQHPVKFFERGYRPLEIVSSRQWYLRTMVIKDRLLERGREMEWLPPFMRLRYENWVEGLTGDWALSRQRFFGVPFPVWYRLDDEGEPIEDDLLLPRETELPIDPSVDAPGGYDDAQRGQPGGFIGDADVMDTWATSSLTPHIAGRYLDDPDLFERVFPTDLRPQAHEIIRTWLFTTVVRSELENSALPWSHAAISGWILDPEHKKISKSKGNAIVPTEPLERHGTDAVRYWAASARLGADSAYDDQEMRVGRRLALKVLNATRFVLSLAAGEQRDDVLLEPLDGAMLAALDEVIEESTASFERLDYARALETTEAFFWRFCDDYLELVKERAYGDAAEEATASSHLALRRGIETLVALLAPVLVYACEEAWSWFHEGSVHTSTWPRLVTHGNEAPELLFVAGEVLVAIRRAKSEAHLSMRSPVGSCVVRGEGRVIEMLRTAAGDLCRAGVITALEFEEKNGPLEVEVVLG